MIRIAVACCLALACAVSASAAPIVLAPGQVEAELVAEINAAPGDVAHPVSLAPDAWFGVNDRLTIGIVNSHLAVDRYDPGASVCLGTLVLACDHAYTGSGLDARWLALDGAFAIAPRARLLVRDVDPWKPAVTVGALVRWTRGRFELAGDPYLQFGLANVQYGNRAQLFLPLALGVRPAARWLVQLRTGYDSDLDVWSDGYHVPAWLGVTFAAAANLDVGVAVGFASVFGPQASGKERQGYLIVDWRS